MKKIILITGSTDGIGKLAAIKLAKEGHKVYLHGRKAAKLARVISEVKNSSNNENVHGFVADFSDLQAVKQMAVKIKAELSKIDILINNAGVYKSSSRTTKDGLEVRFAVNYLAPYLLTHELIQLLQNSDAPRLINLSSAAQSSVSQTALTGEVQRSEQEMYAQSKLALTMWSFYLAKKYPGISVIAVNPGSLLNTNMVREAYGRHWSSADKGGNILHELAVSKVYNGLSGKYFDNDSGDFNQAHPDAYNATKIENLIKTTERLLLV